MFTGKSQWTLSLIMAYKDNRLKYRIATVAWKPYIDNLPSAILKDLENVAQFNRLPKQIARLIRENSPELQAPFSIDLR